MRFDFDNTVLTAYNSDGTLNMDLLLAPDHLVELTYCNDIIIDRGRQFRGVPANERFVDLVSHGSGTRIYNDRVYAVALLDEGKIKVGLDVEDSWRLLAEISEDDSGAFSVEVFSEDPGDSTRFTGGLKRKDAGAA